MSRTYERRDPMPVPERFTVKTEILDTGKVV